MTMAADRHPDASDPSDRALQERADRRRLAGTQPAFDLEALHRERARWAEVAAWLGPPAGVALEHATVPGGPAVTFVVPTGARRDRVVTYLHPGGYVQGSLEIGVHNAARFARAAGLVLCAVGYRRAPEHVFPAALDDALATQQWLLAEGFAPDGIGLLGESAGGGLALATLVAMRDRGIAMPAVAALVSPWADLTGTASGQGRGVGDDPALADAELTPYARWYAGTASTDDPLISPVRASLRGLPPLLVAYGEFEMLASDSERTIANARRDGITCEVFVGHGADHCFTTLAETDIEARRGVDAVADWLVGHLVSDADNLS